MDVATHRPPGGRVAAAELGGRHRCRRRRGRGGDRARPTPPTARPSATCTRPSGARSAPATGSRYAEDDLKEARKDGHEAADDARTSRRRPPGGAGNVPPACSATPGAPAAAAIAAARPVRARAAARRPDQPSASRRRTGRAGRSRGSSSAAARWTALPGIAGHRQDRLRRPGEDPGRARRSRLEHAYHDPIGTGKALVGYDELANGRCEDWLGQMGIGVLGRRRQRHGPARGARLNRVVGSPKIEPLGTNAPTWARSVRRPAARLRQARSRRARRLRAADDRATDRRAARREVSEGRPLHARWLPRLHARTPRASERERPRREHGPRQPEGQRGGRHPRVADPPDGYTWHHVEDGRTMELVPERPARGRQAHRWPRGDAGSARRGRARAACSPRSSRGGRSAARAPASARPAPATAQPAAMKIEIRDDRPPVSAEALAAAEAAAGEDRPPHPAELQGVPRRAGRRQAGPQRVPRSASAIATKTDTVRLFLGIAESPNGDLVRGGRV